MLKAKGCKIFDQTKGSHKSFKSYACDTPLVVLGSFQTKIEANEQSMISRFYVIKNGQKSLISTSTAVTLGLLEMKAILQVETKFPKMKGQ